MIDMIEKKQLGYMQAWIKTYADGTQILQSYDTDVVKRTPDGKLIRLWKSWSVTTSRQVRRWCGVSFRDLPFEDGTVEDRSPQKRVTGYDLYGVRSTRTPDARYDGAPTSKSQLTIDWYKVYYKTFYNKIIRQLIKDDKEAKLLLQTADACAKGSYIKWNNTNCWNKLNYPEPKTVGALTAKLYNYDFFKIYETE